MILSTVGTPMNDCACAKYQHPKNKFCIFFLNHKIASFTFFEGLKKGLFKEKEKKGKNFLYVLDPI